MHEAIVEVAKLVEDLAQANRIIDGFKEVAKLDKENALNALGKEMQQALIESDIKREVAIARLEAYERTVNKDDFNREVREMLKLAIGALSNKPIPQPQKGGQQPPPEQIGLDKK